jgi:hypothetical protein
MTVVAWAALFLLLQAPTQQQSPKASIEGFVLRAGTNEPIRAARITLTRAATPGTVINITPANAIPPVTSDSQGRFLATGLEAGTYTLTAQRNGFARQTYGERAVGRPGVPLNVLAGQAVKDIVFHLTPAGAISGRITDSTGEPLSSITVQLLQSRYDGNGRRTFQQVGTGKTDDRGEYRIYWITPGRYYVSASPNRSQLTPLQPSTNEVTDPGFAVTFYPGTTDPASATSIELQPGEELNTIDLTMPMQQLYRIRGRVFDPKTGQFPRNASILLMPRTPSISVPNFLSTANAYNSVNGTFDIRDIAPGSYLLEVQSITLAGDSTPRQSAAMAVDVSNADVENLIVSFTPGITVSGHVSIEGGTAVSSLPNADMLRVFLTPTVAQVIIFTGPQSVAADGSFKIDNTQVGEYRINVSPLPPGMYVKDARLGSTDALAGISITGPVSGSLEVLLSPNGGQLDGTIVDKDQKPQRGIQAVLIPDRQRERRDLYRTATSDQNGHFVIRSVPPGDYKLFAWEDLEPFAYSDPDILRRYEALGLSVKVAESAKLTVEAKIIPAGQ